MENKKINGLEVLKVWVGYYFEIFEICLNYSFEISWRYFVFG